MDLSVILTYRCDSRCSMCYIWKNPTNPQAEVTLETQEKIMGTEQTEHATRPQRRGPFHRRRDRGGRCKDGAAVPAAATISSWGFLENGTEAYGVDSRGVALG